MFRNQGFALPVLVVEDDEIQCVQTEQIIERAGINQEVFFLHTGERVLQFLRDKDAGVVLLDLTLPDRNGESLLEEIRRGFPQVPVIIVTASEDVSTAVRCMRKGALDYLIKPIEPNKLVADIKVALEMRILEIENRLLTDRFLKDGDEVSPVFEGIVTRNSAMRSIFKYIEAIAKSPKVVLITGETGTGKELVAQAIHAASGRPGQMLAVNAAELDDSMFSDTLFGHRKGAYTGADERRKGLVEAAGEGTLFLDEIGDLGMQAQTKLLRFLESGESLPIGIDVPAKTKVRVVTATNRDIDAAAAGGTFRRDLYYRLSVHRIRIPPLRERREDISLLLDHFLRTAAAELGLAAAPAYPPSFPEQLENYDFPGNVRELGALVFDAVSRSSGATLDTTVFRNLPEGPHRADGADCADVGLFSQKLPRARLLLDDLYATALERTGGNQNAAAKLIGVSQQTLSSWLRRNHREHEPPRS
jgi:two-component system nitrogen regulation response regulator GlnG